MSRRTDLALLLLLSLLWGTSYALIRIAVGTIPPLTLVAVRVTLATGVLQLLLAARGVALPRPPISARWFPSRSASCSWTKRRVGRAPAAWHWFWPAWRR
jgi:drug/metabolite transporter (DMT)-like permease